MKAYQTFSKIILGMIMLTFSVNVMAQTNFYSGVTAAIKKVENTQYALRGDAGGTKVSIFTDSSGLTLEDNYYIPSYDATPHSELQYKMLDVSFGGKCIFSALVDFYNENTSMIFDPLSGTFLETKRISTNDDFYGIYAVKALSDGFYTVFSLTGPGSSIAVAKDYTANVLNGLPYSYNTALSGDQYVITHTDFNGDNPRVVTSLHGFTHDYMDASKNDILHELNGNLLLKFEIFGTRDTKYIEIDRLTGNVINTYDFVGPTDMVQDTATGNIYISYHSCYYPYGSSNYMRRNYIEKRDSNMNLIRTSQPQYNSIIDIEITENGLFVMEGVLGSSHTEGFVFYDKESLFPVYSPASNNVERPSVWANSSEMQNQIIQVANDGLSAQITFYYTGNILMHATGAAVTVNNINIPDVGFDHQTVSYVKDLSKSADALSLNLQQNMYQIYNESALSDVGDIVNAEQSFVVEYYSDVNIASSFGSIVDVSLLNPAAGWNTTPRAGMAAPEIYSMNWSNFGNIDTNELGQYYCTILTYHHTASLPVYGSAVERKYYKIFFKNVAFMIDSDGDGIEDHLDLFPNDPTEWADSDGDGVGDNADVFPNDPTEWADSDGDNVGDNADVFHNDPTEWADSDGDGIGDNSDNCINTPNPDQADLDGDGVGDLCDNDIDGDGYDNDIDAFPNDPTEWADSDGDGIGDNSDNCINTPNPDQADLDGDGVGDLCDNDIDGDGYDNDIDRFPYNPDRWRLETGIEDFDSLAFNIYPNPVVTILFIESEIAVNTTEILDCLGRSIYKQSTGLNQIDVSLLSKGMYFIKISIEDSFVIKRFIKN